MKTPVIASTTAQKNPRRRMLPIVLSLFAASVGLSATAYAADDAGGRKASAEEREKRGHRGHGDPAKLIQRFDTNKDGKLAVSELPEKLKARLGAADANKDGVISLDELRARAAAHQKERFARIDKNGDGLLTQSEVGDKRWAHIKVADQNGDSKITAAELSAAHAAGKLKHGHKRHGGSKNDA